MSSKTPLLRIEMKEQLQAVRGWRGENEIKLYVQRLYEKKRANLAREQSSADDTMYPDVKTTVYFRLLFKEIRTK